jgi:hypothetical protein
MVKKLSYSIYGAGDLGTRELRSLFFAKGIRADFYDTRISDNDRENLATLQKLGLRTVPQVFRPDGKLIGGYEEAIAHLNGVESQAPKMAPSVA